ncbi:hypothetical protein KR093_002123 [Drosophila rubida]|uniref:[histone H3]-lysine(36) N-trimethyltransferase n=1 Tax=Drosophila rubida TaxID=30044 RepID=A0AAD4PK35_9MUSC|nr:hypothetical protein KR093_002123 [Drosophila rubida]
MENFTPDGNEKKEAPRKRLGRPPKSSNQVASEANEESDAAIAVADNSLCRRSTRKKIAKFDVLDVLNKSRKTHKIQIEARIDSNTPTTSAPQASNVPTTSPINRFIATRAPQPTTPVLPALELFTKPKPTPSLIVLQVSSDKTQELPLRKRGRPRKQQFTDNTQLDDNMPSTSAQMEVSAEIVTSLSGESSDSDLGVVTHVATNLELQDENAVEPSQASNDTETEIITVLQSDEEDSDSQIIFVEIETETPIAGEEQEDNSNNSTEQRSFKLIFPKEQQEAEATPDDSNSSAQQLIAAVEQQLAKDDKEDEEQPATELDLMAEELSEPASDCVIEEEVVLLVQDEQLLEVTVEDVNMETVTDDMLETTDDAKLETVNDLTPETVYDVEMKTVDEAKQETVDEEKQDEAKQETPEEAKQKTIDEAKQEMIDESKQETIDEASQETIDEPMDAVDEATLQSLDEVKPHAADAAKLEAVDDVKLIAAELSESPTVLLEDEIVKQQQSSPAAVKEVIQMNIVTKLTEEIVEQQMEKSKTEESNESIEQPKTNDSKDKAASSAAPDSVLKAEALTESDIDIKTIEQKQMSTELADKTHVKTKPETKETDAKQAKKQSPINEVAAASIESIIKSEPSVKTETSTSKIDVAMESRPTDKKKTTDSPGPSPKREKAATPAKLPIVECDALFKVLDEANAQMRQEEKTKKKLKQSAKAQKQKQETPKQTSPIPAAAATVRGKKSQGKKGSRRNTISEDQQEKGKETPPVPSKRRNSLHPFKPSPSPERRTESTKKAKEKKPTRKAATGKDAPETATKAELPSRRISTPTSEAEESFLLGDIAKFIEDGVKLLERDYRVEDEQQQPPQEAEAEEQQQQQEDEFATRVANLETPATTPTPSPAVSTEDLSSGVRRSHRIKQKPQGAKSSQGRGSSAHTPAISMADQLSELAHIEAINEQFLRHEGLNTFQTLRDNYYRCARQVSKENAEMQCDCFVTGDEEGSGQMRCGDGCINRMLMIECGPLCTNADRCTNKRFQQHQGWPCRVFRTEKKGCGITAELQIPPGEFIMEYVGEVIDSEEFERRQHLYSEDRNRHYYFMALRGEAIIDATSKGNISRYINHSCDPNAETQKWTVNGELRIGFFSVKTILPGEEITFDYQYQRYGRDAQRCYCESANCRGWIGNEPESDEGEQLDTESDSEQESLNEEPRLEQEQKPKASKGAKPKAQSKLPATRKKRKEQPKAKDREYKAGRWLRPSGGSSGEKSASGKHDHIEDPDVLEQLTLLSRSGLKNQLDTLRFSRCMVRAKLLQSRLQLLGVLTRGELPCRRLFLDYHGLRLLHAWISESGSDQQLRLALLDALESLPIPNKTMLNDSRIYQSVQLWSSQSGEPPEPNMERILALLQKWNGLPEIFRIPKRERIEQMKEHEREADRQQQQPALEESNSNAASVLSSDRYRQDRFRRDTSSRYEKSKPPSRMSGNNTICTITSTTSSEGASGGGGGKSESRRRSEFDPRRTISKELRRSLFERKVAQDEAEKRVGSEDFREHELRCEYFGADLNTDPKLLPFYQNTETNEWFNSDDQPVPAPLRCGDIAEPPSPESPADVEYKLPPHIEPLPLSWAWARTPEGDIYYYHLRDREPQWEPPNAEQRLKKLVEDEPEPEQPTEAEDAASADHLIKVDIDFGAPLSAAAMDHLVEIKVRERREKRRNRLVSVRVISPRREEDRLYNQQESRKYKENKEKIRRRKEVYRRTRNESSAAEPEDEDQPADALPIHRYLYSSDEEATTDGDCLPDAEGEQEPGRSSEAETLSSSKRKLPLPEAQKKHRSERDKKRKTASIAREASDKFHFEISGHVAEFLRPYRQETCQLGRITSDEDYKFLIKRLSHHITTKETRYCEMTSNPLACTESVKHKSYDFIKQYMRKKGPIYKKPLDKMD